eukprot:2871128-Rhodomonas_salina.8
MKTENEIIGAFPTEATCARDPPSRASLTAQCREVVGGGFDIPGIGHRWSSLLVVLFGLAY